MIALLKIVLQLFFGHCDPEYAFEYFHDKVVGDDTVGLAHVLGVGGQRLLHLGQLVFNALLFIFGLSRLFSGSELNHGVLLGLDNLNVALEYWDFAAGDDGELEYLGVTACNDIGLLEVRVLTQDCDLLVIDGGQQADRSILNKIRTDGHVVSLEAVHFLEEGVLIIEVLELGVACTSEGFFFAARDGGLNALSDAHDALGVSRHDTKVIREALHCISAIDGDVFEEDFVFVTEQVGINGRR